MPSVDSWSSVARPRAVCVAATHATAASVAGPARAATRSSHAWPPPPAASGAGTRPTSGTPRRSTRRAGLAAPRGKRLAHPPRLGHAERLEAVDEVVLGVGGVERVEERAPARGGDGLVVQRDELRRVLALDARVHEVPDRRALRVQRL